MLRSDAATERAARADRARRHDPTEADDLRRKLDTVLRQATAQWRRALYQAIVTEDVLNIETQYMTPAERKSRLGQIAAAAAALAFTGMTPSRIAATIARAYVRGRGQALQEFARPKPGAPASVQMAAAAQNAGVTRTQLETVVARSVEDLIEEAEPVLQEPPATPATFWRLAVLPAVTGIIAMRMKALSTTSVSRTVNAGKLDAYGEQGVTTVGIIPEHLAPEPRERLPGEPPPPGVPPLPGGGGARYGIQTAGDDRVCARCTELSQHTYTLQEARDLLPVHINCRCVVVQLP